MWCVSADADEIPVQLPGPDGALYEHKLWLKRELSVGEQRDVETSGFRSVRGFTPDKARPGEAADPSIQIDWRAQSFARAVAYLTNWTLADENGNKLPVARATVEALRPPVFDAIEAAINAHVEARPEARGKATGGPSPRATLAS
jgi:hypothetical protein